MGLLSATLGHYLINRVTRARRSGHRQDEQPDRPTLGGICGPAPLSVSVSRDQLAYALLQRARSLPVPRIERSWRQGPGHVRRSDEVLSGGSTSGGIEMGIAGRSARSASSWRRS
jgi:hypothetical protein